MMADDLVTNGREKVDQLPYGERLWEQGCGKIWPKS